MKQKKVKKLNLSKDTIANLDMVLNWKQQKAVNGGGNKQQSKTTDAIIFCRG